MPTCEGYGYGGRLREIREEYGTLPRAYLDNAGAPLFPHTLPRLAAEALCLQPLKNPHSQTEQASGSSQIIASVRTQVLRNLGCDPSEYDIIFCANATAAAKLVGEALYSYDYAYLRDSHTSLVGLRELSKSFRICDTLQELVEYSRDRVVSWPLQSNFDGRRYSESDDIISAVHAQQGLVLLDIASFVATEAPDLGQLKPDFAVLSFYKMYGLPDLGALIVRKSPAVQRLLAHKRYFGGGTVAALAPGESYVSRKQSLVDMLEDGTAPFHSILVLQVAMQEFRRLFGSAAEIAKHTKLVARYCKERLRHVSRCTVLAPSDSPIVSFMLQDVGHNEFCTAAALQDVHVRAGTLCNIGAFTNVSEVDDQTIKRNHEMLGKTCNDEISFIDNQPTGVVRVSFGPYSSYDDVDALMQVIDSVTATTAPPCNSDKSKELKVSVSALYTYPIKSCCGVRVSTSRVDQQGLQYDREFCLLDLSSNKVLSLKKYRSMASIKPAVNASTLVVQCGRKPAPNSIRIPYDYKHWPLSDLRDQFVLNILPEVVEFFTQAVGVPCTIAKQRLLVERAVDSATLAERNESSLANSSPLLLVSLPSSAALDLPDVSVFRPNIVVEAPVAWAEDTWSELSFPQASIQLLGKCRRCSMVTVTASGECDSTPYMQLCKHRKHQGKIYFGQHARLAAGFRSMGVLSVGDRAVVK